MNELTRTPETVGAEIRGLTAQAKQMTLWFGIEIGRRLCEVKEMSDVTVAQFKIIFDTVQGNLNDMLALIAKASGENQTKLRAAAEKLVDAFKGRIES